MSHARLSFRSRMALVVPILAASWAADQMTKGFAARRLKGAPEYSYLHDMFRLSYSENNGAFLSLGSDLPPGFRFWLLTVGVGGILGCLLVYLLRARQATARQLAGIALVCAGGLSNWLDRVLSDGYVIDFMNVGVGRLRSGIFNVADLLIDAGVVLLIWDVFQKRERRSS